MAAHWLVSVPRAVLAGAPRPRCRQPGRATRLCHPGRLSRSGRWSRPRSSTGGASRRGANPGRRRSLQLKHPDVQHGSLMQGGPQRPVQAVFQVKLPVPPDDVRK